MTIYFNNAASSHPKPETMIAAVVEELSHSPANPYRDHADTPWATDRCRSIVADLFHAPNPERVILCSGATEAINMALHGLIREKTHVVATSFEHNAVLRPLYGLSRLGRIRLEIVQVDPYGHDPGQEVIQAIRPDTGLVVVNHTSNVNGAFMEIESIHDVCRRFNIPILIDASQSAGALPINASEMPWALMAFTGHKSLLGPPGTGGLVVGQEVKLEPWKLGGTGIHSEYEEMPDIWPLKFEAGTQNYPGLAGLAASVEYVLERGVDFFSQVKNNLAQELIGQLAAKQGISLYSPLNRKNPCGIVSFTIAGWTPREIGYILQESFQIRVRTGLHCAPLMHRALGTFPDGTIRVSFSTFNTIEEVNEFMAALHAITTKI
ncbi:MAG: aminotransferase class V-fold PLP-dependent enzyme [Thermodesulfobacteriota bacterium]